MAADVIIVGYICPYCGNRVAVLRSSDPPEHAKEIISECKCGITRHIRLEEIQSLDIWREKASS